MTEEEWLTCSDPQPMLADLGDSKASKRKLRLFGCACCRGVGHLSKDSRVQRAIVLAERYADGLVGRRRWPAVQSALAPLLHTPDESVFGARSATFVLRGAAVAVGNLTIESAVAVTSHAAEAASSAAYRYWSENAPGEDRFDWVSQYVRRSVHAEQANWLRCVFGNPYHAVSFDPVWRTNIVLSLARQGYEDRRLDSFLVLSDALEEAGCSHAGLLNHLRLARSPGACRGCGGAGGDQPWNGWSCCRAPRQPPPTHVRGCWALDLVLAKE
jgi:hypothetical protein